MSFRSTQRTVLLLAVLAVAPAFAGPLVLAPGDAAPQVKGYLPDGNFRTVDYSENRLTLLNFWASWCGPCQHEMPVLDELQKLHADQGFEVIGIWDEYTDTDREAVAKFLEAVPVDYVILRAHRHVRRVWPAHGIMPTSYLVDSSGRVMRRYVGATEEQVEGMKLDVAAAVAGETMPTQVYPAPFELPKDLGKSTDPARD